MSIRAVIVMLALMEALALARIIAGETPGCSFEAKLAVAHVAQRNAVWYGDAEPGAWDLAAALWWRRYPDPTDGAQFLLGPGDAERLAPWLGERTGRWVCPGTFVESWTAAGRR